MRWPEKIVPGPSPFTADERDLILDYFKAKRWKVGGFNDTRLHYPYFAFLYTLFFTGMRPSEAVAVRIRSVNLGTRTVQVERSRHLGTESAPKTLRARRAVRLTRGNAEVVESLIELKAQPDDYLFKNVGTRRSKPRIFTTCFATRSGRCPSLRCAIYTLRRTPTFPWHSRMV